MSALPPAHRLRFGDFEIDLDRRVLLRDGKRVDLQDKPFEVLVTLAERPGVVVTREALRERLWADQIVEFDNNLNTALTKVRRALGDSASEPRWIETVPKRGYRWIGEILPEAAIETPTAAPTEPERRGSPSRQAWLLATLGVLIVLLPLLGRPGSWSQGETSTLSPHADSAQRTLLAVLPFVDGKLEGVELEDGEADDGQPGGDLADFWTEELITRLAECLPRKVGVIARTSAMRYRGQALDLRQLTDDLGVRWVVEGSVRSTPQGLQVQARLIEVSSQAHRWAVQLEGPFETLPTLQDEVAQGIASELGVELASRGSSPEIPVPEEAWRAYLRGRHLLQPSVHDAASRTAEAVETLRRTVELAPSFAPGWSALAEALHRHRAGGAAAQTESRRAALRSIALDPNHAEPQLRLGQISLYQDWDWAEADHYLQRADRLAPGSAQVKHVRAAWFSTLGRHEEARAQLDAALRLDPLSVVLHADTGWYDFVARRYEAALARCDEALALDPEHRGARWYRLRSLLALDRQAEAAEQALDLLVTEGAGVDRLERARRNPEQALELLFTLRRDRFQAEVEAGRPSQPALALASLDLASLDAADTETANTETALQLLLEGAEHRGAWIYPFLAVYPPLDPLRDNSSFRQLVERVVDP